jgi:peptide/nickel transport system substrate-binding protein
MLPYACCKIFCIHPVRCTMRCLAVLAAILLAFCAMPAMAAENDCGTIVIPPGIGIGPGADVTSFNMLFIDSLYNQEAAELLFMPLLWINRFHEADYSRSLASGVSTPDGGRTFDVTLRPWIWSDGTPVTTADVVYTFNLIKQLGPAYPGYQEGGIPNMVQSITAKDATHVEFKLTQPVNASWFILNGLGQIYVFPQHVWSRYTLDQIMQAQSSPAFFAVVDGPLKIKTLAVGLYAEFVPNPAYPGPKMHFSRFVMKFMDSEGAELQGVEAGDLDVSNLPFTLWDAARHLTGVHVEPLLPSYSWHETILNLQNPGTPFFSDVRVRDAIADAIDQNQIVALAMHGQGVPVYGPVPPVPASFLSPAARARQYPVSYDPAHARALLREAGYAPGPDGIMRKGNEKLAFTVLIPAGQPMRIEMSEVIQQDLAAVGIALTTRQVEFNQIMALQSGPSDGWQAIIMAEDITPFPSGEDNFSTNGFYNTGHYSNPKMDALISASINAQGLNGLFAFEDFASAEQPVIFLPVEKYSLLVSNRLHGVGDFLNPLGEWAPDQLYCSGPAR